MTSVKDFTVGHAVRDLVLARLKHYHLGALKVVWELERGGDVGISVSRTLLCNVFSGSSPLVAGINLWKADDHNMLLDLRCAKAWCLDGALVNACARGLEHLQRYESSADPPAAGRGSRQVPWGCSLWKLQAVPFLRSMWQEKELHGPWMVPPFQIWAFKKGWVRKSCLSLHPWYLGCFQFSYYLSQRSLSEYLGFVYNPRIPAFSFTDPQGCVIPVGILVHIMILEREKGRSSSHVK